MTTATQVVKVVRPMNVKPRISNFWSVLLPPAILGLIVFLSWELIVRLANVPAYILPAPTAIFNEISTSSGLILAASKITTLAVLGGIGLGTLLGIIGAVAVTYFEKHSKLVLLLVAIISSAPIVALAPIFNAWFGATNLFSKIAIASIMVFFPVMVNTTTGLLNMSLAHKELMESLGAKQRQVLFFVRVPGALPSFVDGLKVGVSLAVIGVIVAEYFGGPASALGVVIANSAAVSKFTLTWAAVFLASALGIGLYATVLLIERIITPWKK